MASRNEAHAVRGGTRISSWVRKGTNERMVSTTKRHTANSTHASKVNGATDTATNRSTPKSAHAGALGYAEARVAKVVSIAARHGADSSIVAAAAENLVRTLNEGGCEALHAGTWPLYSSSHDTLTRTAPGNSRA